MKRARFLTVIGIISLAILLIAGSPVTRVEADHCHSTQNQAPAASAAPPARPAPSTAERSRSSRRIATPIPAPQNAHAQSKPAGSAPAPSNAANASIEEIYSRDLPAAIQSIGQAVKAIESGDRQTELAELTRAVTLLASIHESLGKHVRSLLANSRCPIMGSVINPDSVPANLMRDYKGQKVGFCCGQCPSAWDKLSDADKQAKLSAVKS